MSYTIDSIEPFVSSHERCPLAPSQLSKCGRGSAAAQVDMVRTSKTLCSSHSVQQPSHSLPTTSAILISVRSRSAPKHRPHDANEQQCGDWPMKPDLVRVGENIDEYQKARNREGRCNGARQARQPIRDGTHPRGWLGSVANPLSASFRGCNCSGWGRGAVVNVEAVGSADLAAHGNSIADDGSNVLHLLLAETVEADG